jgi:hypothetical protein
LQPWSGGKDPDRYTCEPTEIVLTFEDVKITEAEVDEGNEEVIRLSEPEIDFETDPFQPDSAMKPGKDWED